MFLKNISRLVTMSPSPGRIGPLGVVEDACVRVSGERIEWIGPLADAPAIGSCEEVIDCGGSVVLPGLIDCHTHLIHAGSRAHEFRMRAVGKTYQEIAKDGGGILSTVRATRDASEDALLMSAKDRADEMLARGITTVEIKSGYGLDIKCEEKILKVARMLSEHHPIDVVPTFLGAHVVPPEFRDKRNEYVDLVANEMLPRFGGAGLCRFCDVFVEEGAFTKDEARRIAKAADSLGIRIRMHIDQFGDGGGGLLAAELKAISADHCDYVSDEGMQAMAKAGVVAVLLPAAVMFAKSGRYAPGRRLIDNGVCVAVSTDFNPGTSPTTDLLLCATLAVVQMGLTIDEALMAITRNAARTLGLEDEIGSIEVGKCANLVSFAVPHEDDLLYRFGTNFAKVVIKNGKIVFKK